MVGREDQFTRRDARYVRRVRARTLAQRVHPPRYSTRRVSSSGRPLILLGWPSSSRRARFTLSYLNVLLAEIIISTSGKALSRPDREPLPAPLTPVSRIFYIESNFRFRARLPVDRARPPLLATLSLAFPPGRVSVIGRPATFDRCFFFFFMVLLL